MARLHFFLGILFSLLFSSYSWAYKDGDMQLGAGVLPYNVMKTTNAADASKSQFSDVYYALQLRGAWMMFGPDAFFAPRLTYTPLTLTAKDGATEKSILLLSLPYSAQFGASKSWDWSAGLGLLRYTQKGKGGTVVLQNGTGYSTFSRPSRTSTSQVVTVELGLGKSIGENWYWGNELILTGLLTERRSYSLLITFNYSWMNTGL